MYEVYLEILKRKGLKSADVAKATGIPASTFSDWKKGKSKPKHEKIVKIATFLGVDIEDLTNKKVPEKIFSKNYLTYYGDLSIQALNLVESMNDTGKEKAIDYLIDLSKLYPKEKECDLAAHEIETATKEEQEHDKKIMDDDKF